MTKRKSYPYIFFVLSVLFIVARFVIYPEPQLSIGTNDTKSYIQTSQKDFTDEFFTSIRPVTLPILYKIFTPEDGYNLTAVSEPALIDVRVEPTLQSGFDNIVVTQMLVSLVAWISFAWFFTKRLHNQIVKISTVIFLYFFALSPHVAEWDIVLQSESLHISLFVLAFSFFIELVFLTTEKEIKRPGYSIMAFLFCVTSLLWQYTRDANLYSMVITLTAMLAGMLWVLTQKKKISAELIIVCLLFGSSIVFHNQTLNSSYRWEQPLMSNIRHNVLPYDTRVAFFVDNGMPNVETLIENLNAGIRGGKYSTDKEFMEWLHQEGSQTYKKFLINTPLWATTSFISDLEDLFSWNLQPYHTTKGKWRNIFLPIGNMLHSKSSVVLLTSVLMIASCFLFVKGRDHIKLILVNCLIFINASAILFISYHGDFYSKGRHAISGTALLRFDYWLLLVVLIDILASRLKESDISLQSSKLQDDSCVSTIE